MKLNESEESEEASLIQKNSQNQMFFDTTGISLKGTWLLVRRLSA